MTPSTGPAQRQPEERSSLTAKRAIAADNDEVNPAPLHEVTGGVVGDDLVGDLLLREFPCGERRALGARASLVAIDVKLPSLGLRGIKGRGGAADIHKGQPTGIAMR